MAVLNLVFRASAELRAEMVASAPADFDFIWVGSECGESRLEVLVQSRQRLARFLQAYALRFDRRYHLEKGEGLMGEELTALSADELALRLSNVQELRVTKKPATEGDEA